VRSARLTALVAVGLAAAAAAACGDGPTDAGRGPGAVPDPVPRDTTPLQGLSRARLYELVDRLASGEFGEVHSLIVQRNGVRVVEAYFRGQDELSQHSLQSVTKSFASAILGIAIDKGYVADVDERVLDFFPQWEEELARSALRSRIEIEDILTMRTGTDYHEVGPDAPHWELNSLPTGWDYYWLTRPMIREPGTFWQYDSGGVIALSSVLKARTGEHANVLADSWLFGPMGILDRRWFVNQEGHPHLGGGLFLTPRNMVKLGQLYLQGGMWEGQRLVSGEWVERSVQRHVDFGVPEPADPVVRLPVVDSRARSRRRGYAGHLRGRGSGWTVRVRHPGAPDGRGRDQRRAAGRAVDAGRVAVLGGPALGHPMSSGALRLRAATRGGAGLFAAQARSGVIALTAIPTTNTVTAPMTLCQSHETEG